MKTRTGEAELLSFGEELTGQERESGFTRVRVSAHESPETVLSMAVPNAWPEVPPLPSDRPGWFVLKTYATSNTAEVDLFQARQEFEVNLEDWLRRQAEILSFTITVSKTIGTSNGEVVHAAATGDNGDRLRLVVAGDGPNLFFEIGRAAAAEPPRTDGVLGMAARSLIFEKHSGRNTREELEKYADERGRFQLIYPKSWSMEPDENGLPVVDFRVTDSDNTLAYAHVVADPAIRTRAAGIRTAIEDAKAEAKEAGVEIEELEKLPGSGEVERFSGPARTPAGDGQVFLAIRNGVRAVVLSPTRDRNPMIWMRAKRFHEILCMSLGGPAD